MGEHVYLLGGVWTVGEEHQREAYNLGMRLHQLFIAVLLAITVGAAAKTMAPPTIPHPMAMYLQTLSNDGKDKVTFRASAIGTHFFLEEPSGVTVYVYEESVGYKKEAFLKGATLASALKKYR
jgi:hypothetical protein